MPSLPGGRKRQSSVISEDDDQSLYGLTGSDVPSASKRPRLSEASRSQSPDGPLLPDSYRATQQHGANGTYSTVMQHQPGSIVRVSLRNFVTYTKAEFLPGPSLNMVIGPNGTGKSTLVCAICLGLGWKTEHLGRAKEIGEFVKHGAKNAEIEIELARDPKLHKANPIIRHNIRKEGNKSTFFLDDKTVSRKQINHLCRTFSIQVDNLCQFLPQDRVVEFAALSPEDLLAQTQRAAAPEYMAEWHEKLKDDRKKQKSLQSDQHTLAELLKNLENRQNLQRTDVERLRERQNLQERVVALEMLRPVPAYRVARSEFKDAKTRQRAANAELERLTAEVEPALRAVNAKQEYRDGVLAAVRKKEHVLEITTKRAREIAAKETSLAENMKEADRKAESEKEVAKRHRQERARIESSIQGLERQLNEPAPEFNGAEMNEKNRDFARQIRELEDRAREINDKQKECVGQINVRKDRMRRANNERTEMQSQAGQQNKKLEKASPDTFRAWDWIQINLDKFSGPVYGPPIVSCSVKDQRHANAVESMLTLADMTAFTVTDQADFRTLQRQLYRTMGLKDINIRNSSDDAARYRPPVPKDELSQYGLDAYLIDLIEGPDRVLAMLCDNRNAHQTGVAFKDLSDQQYEALTQTSISSFVTPRENFVITRRREYGAQSTRSRTVEAARFFTEQAIDSRAEQELTAQIREANGEIEELARQAREHLASVSNLGEEVKELKDQQRELAEEKNRMQQALSIYNGLPTKIDGWKKRLAKVDENQATLRSRLEEIQIEKDKFVMQKAQEVINYATTVTALQKLHADLFHFELVLIEAESDAENLEARNTEVRDMLEQRRTEVANLERQAERLNTEARKQLELVKSMMDRRTPRQNEVHNEQPEGQTPADLEIEIERLHAQLEMVHEGNPHILREYEERGVKIEKTKDKLQGTERELQATERKITSTREQWEPELDALVAKISHAFADNMSRIGCAGQVEVYKDEDFDLWSIQVLVKFREHESMSILDSHRQSGGERAVSTIFYLMALQSLARAPFRVVDEINQGMDPRNERLVHSRIVNIACAEHTSQYFLITPKLLPNLTYHPSMKVHCIASGEYMPSDHKSLDFQALAEKALGMRRRASGIAG